MSPGRERRHTCDESVRAHCRVCLARDEQSLDQAGTSEKVTCRACFARVDLSADRLDETPLYVYYRCPVCDQCFPIRRSDGDRLRGQSS